VLAVYSPGLRRKKKASITMSEIALMESESEVEATIAIRETTENGIGLTLPGGGSDLS
jgi:hypothetical protein